MYVVQFPSYQLVEYQDPLLFKLEVGRWMEIREAENNYLLGRLPQIMSQARLTGNLTQRLFALKEGEHFVAAGVLFEGGCFCHTWASQEMVKSFVDGLISAKCQIAAVLGPAHVSWNFAQKLGERLGQKFEIGRAERIYQLGRMTNIDLPSGRLEQVEEKDVETLFPWLQGFIAEAEYEVLPGNHRHLLHELVRGRSLYVWKDPEPVAMAAWTAPTAHGASINFVYTPREFRGKGYGKAVVTGLAKRMLDSGLEYLFIMVGTNDERANKLYQSVGARTLCELLRCSLVQELKVSLGGLGQGATVRGHSVVF